MSNITGGGTLHNNCSTQSSDNNHASNLFSQTK